MSQVHQLRSRHIAEQLIGRVRAEYLKMPGLALTKGQMGASGCSMRRRATPSSTRW